MDLAEYVTNSIIDMLERYPDTLSAVAVDDVLQMEILREYLDATGNLLIPTGVLKVTAVQTFNGRFELLSLSTPLLMGMPMERMGSLDRQQLTEALKMPLPETDSENAFKQALGAVLIVPGERWLVLKRRRQQHGNPSST